MIEGSRSVRRNGMFAAVFIRHWVERLACLAAGFAVNLLSLAGPSFLAREVLAGQNLRECP